MVFIVRIADGRSKIAPGRPGAIRGVPGTPAGRSNERPGPPQGAPWTLPGRSWGVSGRSGALPERPGTLRRRVGQRSEVVFGNVRVRTRFSIDFSDYFSRFSRRAREVRQAIRMHFYRSKRMSRNLRRASARAAETDEKRWRIAPEIDPKSTQVDRKSVPGEAERATRSAEGTNAA
jgi:hypothetical protein